MPEATEPAVIEVSRRRSGFGPAPDVEAVRDGAGIVRAPTPFGPPSWLLTRHEDVRRMLGDTTGFSNGWTTADLVGGATRDPRHLSGDGSGNLLSMDPPDHNRLRRMLTPEFTVRRMRRMEPRITEIVDEHLDLLERHGSPADLVAQYALPIPSLVICECWACRSPTATSSRSAPASSSTSPSPTRTRSSSGAKRRRT
ncbi:hypothetical protein [Saccharopolyspora sp. NPDC049426]|uniref:hypothetical protein n=1 Tax=Saccharopolyspora sp. NPDC049426 TaxID=3155652 RepID=UPI003415E560